MTLSPSIKIETLRHRVVVDAVPRGRKGSGAEEFHYPCSVAVAGNRAFVVDSWNHRVQVFDLPGWKYAFEFGGFFCPKWIEVVEEDGRTLLMVVDSNNRRLTFHELSGDIVAEYKTTYRRFPVMASLTPRAKDGARPSPSGRGWAGRVREQIEITFEDGSTQTHNLSELLHPSWWATKLQKPVSLARDPRGFIYVSDFGRRVVEKFDAEGTFVSQVLSPEVLKVPGKMALNGDDLLLTDRPANVIHIYNTLTAEYRRWDYPFPAPGVIGRDPACNVWIGEYKPEPDAEGSSLYVFNPDYDFVRTVRLAECQQPTAVAVTGNYILVADQSARNVLIFDEAGAFIGNLRPEPYPAPVWAVTFENGHISVGVGPVVDLLWAADLGRLYCIDFDTATVAVKNLTE